MSRNTLYGEFFEGKISLISYPFFKPANSMSTFGSVSLLAPSNIAVMKIIAISQRGKKRDFFNLFWLCQNVRSLNDFIVNVDSQYNIRQNLTHILKSLVYFEDAESDPSPDIFFKANWQEIKDYFKKEVLNIINKIISE